MIFSRILVRLAPGVFFLTLCCALPLAAQSSHARHAISTTHAAHNVKPARPAGSKQELQQKAVQFLREKYGIPDSVQLSPSELSDSANPLYYQMVVTVNDGKQTKTQDVSIARNGRYLVMGNFDALGANTSADILNNIRQTFKIPPTTLLSLGASESSPIPNFYLATVTASSNGNHQSQKFYVTKDKRYLAVGTVFTIMSPGEVQRLLNTRNQPAVGPANAPVTVVEFADLECPMCARVQQFLEQELLPRYKDKVRLVFMDFPLPMHDWSHVAALASQCSYQMKPSVFENYRSMIFAHQAEINVTNVRDLLLQYGEQVGLDRMRLAACVDSKASLPRVEADLHMGNALEITSTPTFFINGKPVVGLQPESLFQAIDDAMRQPKTVAHR